MSFNISGLSFTFSAILSALIAWRAFQVNREEENRVMRSFVWSLVWFTLYVGVRGWASFFYYDAPTVLNNVYILSHVFLGLAASFLAQLGLLSLSKPRWARACFWILIILFSTDVLLNIYLPNDPSYNPQRLIIEWGTNKYVGIYHSLLVLLVFLENVLIFIYLGIKNWHDHLVRNKSLAISGALLLAILLTLPRNLFDSVSFLVVSEISFSLAFAILLWGISQKAGN